MLGFPGARHRIGFGMSARRGVTWAQFMSLQSPLMQSAVGNYAEQSKSAFTLMQEQMQKQAEQMLGAFKPKK